jgi:hypothetical protein
MKRFPNIPVNTDWIAFRGGLDLMTPAMSKGPGFCRDAMNFEHDINGGYVTIEGYERFDGHTPAPSEMTYATLQCEIFGSVAVGQTLTDESGTVSGLIIAITTP